MELFSSEDREQVLLKLIEQESLFRSLSEALDQYDVDHHLWKVTTKVENWVDAKKFVAELLVSRYPEYLVQQKINTLRDNCGCLRSIKRNRKGHYGPRFLENLSMITQNLETESVIMCACCIVHYLISLDGKKHLTKLFDKLSSYLNPDGTKEIMTNLCARMDCDIMVDEIVRDYDYTKQDGGLSEESQTDWPAMVKQKEEEIAQLKQEVEQLKQEHAQLKEKDEQIQALIESNDERVSSKFGSRVQLELLRVLIGRVNLYTNSVKQKHLAKLMSFITGWNEKTCNNYLSSPGLSRTHHSKFLEEIQEELKVTGLGDSLKYTS